MKGHFFFNAWTMATMLAEVLETHETSVDLLILDRGFFDALVWLELQARRGQVTEGEKQVFSEFVLLERWRSLVDVTVLMKVDPEKALQRERQNQIVHRVGSMMNTRALGEFNGALAHMSSEYSDRFSPIDIDTTDAADIVTTNVELLEALLPRIEQWSDPKSLGQRIWLEISSLLESPLQMSSRRAPSIGFEGKMKPKHNIRR